MMNKSTYPFARDVIEGVIHGLEGQGFTVREEEEIQAWGFWKIYLHTAWASMAQGFKDACQDLERAFKGGDADCEEWDYHAADREMPADVLSLCLVTRDRVLDIITGHAFPYVERIERINCLEDADALYITPNEAREKIERFKIEPNDTPGVLHTVAYKQEIGRYDTTAYKTGYTLGLNSILTLLDKISNSPKLQQSFEETWSRRDRNIDWDQLLGIVNDLFKRN